jgi:hypothetical protein
VVPLVYNAVTRIPFLPGTAHHFFNARWPFRSPAKAKRSPAPGTRRVGDRARAHPSRAPLTVSLALRYGFAG